MRVAVTGAGGRLGRALVAALDDAPFTGLAGPIAWTRPDFDLDDGDARRRLIERDRPEVVVHAAAWTDVDGWPATGAARCADNGTPRPGSSPTACAAHGIDFIVVSTNEVFDGTRTDGRGYATGRPADPINAYGASKAAGEAQVAGELRRHRLRTRSAIVRTAWLYGPPGNDFPSKILAAARPSSRLPANPFGSSPTSTARRRTAADVAEAIVELIGSGEVAGTHHFVNGGAGLARRLGARGAPPGRVDVDDRGGPGVDLGPGLDAAAPGPSSSRRRCPCGEPMRPWPEALADYLPAAAPPAADGSGGRRRDRPRAPAVVAVRRPLRRDRPPRRRRGAFRELWRAVGVPGR